MPAVTGIAFLVQVQDGTDWVSVAGQRSATLNRTAEEADVTSKTSEGWYEGIPTFKNWSIDFDGLVMESDTSYALLEDAYMNGETIQVQLITPAGNKYTGSGYLTEFPIEAPYDDAATYSGTIQGTGELVKTSGGI